MRALLAILVIAGGITFASMMVRKPEEEEEGENETYNPAQAVQSAVTDALAVYPRAVVQNAERIEQHETGVYTKQFTFGTNGAQMEAVGNNFPYGWHSLTAWWQANPQYAPVGVTNEYNYERTGTLPLIVFPSFKAGFFTLCEFLNTHENNAGRWHSVLLPLQLLYKQQLQQYTPTYS